MCACAGAAACMFCDSALSTAAEDSERRTFPERVQRRRDTTASQSVVSCVVREGGTGERSDRSENESEKMRQPPPPPLATAHRF